MGFRQNLRPIAVLYFPCVHGARYEDAPDFRKLALLDGISCILHAHGASCLGSGISACLDILLRGIDSADPGVVQKATESILVCSSVCQNRTMKVQ